MDLMIIGLVILGLGISVIVLNRKARRTRYDQFRSFHSRRRYRMTQAEIDESQRQEPPTARDRS